MQTSNHKTNNARQTAGARDVGSGDLLGCMVAIIPSWVFFQLWAACLFAMYQCVRVLVEIYCEDKERRRKNKKPKCEPDNAPGRKLGLLGDSSHQLADARRQSLLCFPRLWKLNVLAYLFAKVINPLLNRFRFTHKRMPPNVRYRLSEVIHGRRGQRSETEAAADRE